MTAKILNRLTDILFWIAAVWCFLLGLKLTTIPEINMHPLGIGLMAFVCHFIDTACRKDSFTIIKIVTEDKDEENNSNED